MNRYEDCLGKPLQVGDFIAVTQLQRFYTFGIIAALKIDIKPYPRGTPYIEAIEAKKSYTGESFRLLKNGKPIKLERSNRILKIEPSEALYEVLGGEAMSGVVWSNNEYPEEPAVGDGHDEDSDDGGETEETEDEYCILG